MGECSLQRQVIYPISSWQTLRSLLGARDDGKDIIGDTDNSKLSLMVSEQ
jgi:hypothetical protein